MRIFAYFAECVFDKPSILKSRAKIGSLESMCEDIAETKPADSRRLIRAGIDDTEKAQKILAGLQKNGICEEHISYIVDCLEYACDPVSALTFIGELFEKMQCANSAEKISDENNLGMKQVRDDDYLSAVNRGDMETAQRMVNEAAA